MHSIASNIISHFTFDAHETRLKRTGGDAQMPYIPAKAAAISAAAGPRSREMRIHEVRMGARGDRSNVSDDQDERGGTHNARLIPLSPTIWILPASSLSN